MKQLLRRSFASIALITGIVCASAGIPTVYDRENTAKSYPQLTFKQLEELPEIPTLPDPFTFADGSRSTDFADFADWEGHRSERQPHLCKAEEIFFHKYQ